MSSSGFAPASIGNFSVGFDVLGLALGAVDGSLLGDRVEVSACEQMQLVVSGDYADKVPHDASNLVYQAGVLVQQWLQQQNAGEHCWQLAVAQRPAGGQRYRLQCRLGGGCSACADRLVS